VTNANCMFIRSITADKVHATQLGRNNWERGGRGWDGAQKGAPRAAIEERRGCYVFRRRAFSRARMRFFDVAISGSLINGRRQSTYRSGNARDKVATKRPAELWDSACGSARATCPRFRELMQTAISRCRQCTVRQYAITSSRR